MVTVFDHPSYRNDCNPSIRPQKPIRQTVRVHARTHTRTTHEELCFFSLFPSPFSSPPLPRFLIHLYSAHGFISRDRGGYLY